MTSGISERSFETRVEFALPAGGLAPSGLEPLSQIIRDPSFAKPFLEWLFERLLEGTKAP
jgi:hypothetical protein